MHFRQQQGRACSIIPANLGAGTPATWVLSVTTPNVLLTDVNLSSCKHDFEESRCIRKVIKPFIELYKNLEICLDLTHLRFFAKISVLY